MLSKKTLFAALLAVSALSTVWAQTVDSRIRLNTVGFLPDFPKKATVAAEFTKFWLYDAPAGTSPVYSGGTVSTMRNDDTYEDGLRIADFSGFNTPGRYFIRTNGSGLGQSPEFTIRDDVFTEPFRAAMLGFYLWRCGMAVSASYGGRSYSHGQCHINDGDTRHFSGAGTKNGTGGWHDAGDYNKYIVNSGVTVTLMLNAWEHFWHILENTSLISVSKSGAIPAYLAEVKWNLDWVSKMQANDGKVSHKMTTLAFGGNIMPEKETEQRFFMPWNTFATGSFTAMMAQAARVYAQYDKAFADSCLAKARRSYDVLKANPVVILPDTNISKTGHYFQQNCDDRDKRALAAVEMWETTGEPEFLEDIEKYIPNVADVDISIDWADVKTISALAYLNSKRAGKNPDKAEVLQESLVSVANRLVRAANNHGYGRDYGRYGWGANGSVAGTAYILHSAYLQTGDPKYRHAVQDAAAHLLGRNYYGRSFVTGVGYNPPKNPHDRTSTASGTPWPGRLIGGPHTGKPGGDKCISDATCWSDIASDYYTNEVAINWNAALVYALAALLPGADAYPAPPYPGQTVEIEVSVNYNAAPAQKSVKKTGTARVVKTRGGQLDIPVGAKIYTLNGKLIAHKKSADFNPVINRNGVYLIKFDK